MTEQNVSHERYCLRKTMVYDWGRDTSNYRCAECGERVTYNPTPGEGEVRLVCIDCLHRGSQK